VTTWPAPLLPTPAALRTVSGKSVRVAPPFGLAGWSETPEGDLAVVLRSPGSATPTLADVAAQVPDSATLPPGTLLVILGELEPSGALLARWLGRNVRVARALRTSTLLAFGYERLGGGVDPASGHDLAWGYVSSRPSPAP
jgi:hypothetical protein